jgi:hypothetical protein
MAEQRINLPESDLALPAVTAKDKDRFRQILRAPLERQEMAPISEVRE